MKLATGGSSFIGHAAVLALLLATGKTAQGGRWHQEGVAFGGGTFFGTKVDSAGNLALASFEGANMAFGAPAVSGENTLSSRRSVTDGDAQSEWRFNNRAEVLGEWIRVDLGGDRGVSRVRVLPGRTVEQRPTFFLKGYRVDLAREAAPDDWILVAQRVENPHPEVDTTADSTWIETDAAGAPLPVLGRFVRLRVVSEDPPNWVSIGEIEVYGEGFRAAGNYQSAVFDAGQPVNFGQARFAGETPEGTDLQVQFRAAADTAAWTAWHRVTSRTLAQGREGVPIEGAEPARFLQYRVAAETRHPLRTPYLARVEVDFEERLSASSVTAAIQPRRPVLGEETEFTYVLDAELGAEDEGFDRVRIGLAGTVREVRIEGVPVPEDGYAAEWDAAALRLVLAPAYRIATSARLEVVFTAVLLRPTLAVSAGVASGEGSPINYQNARPAGEEAWILTGSGFMGRPLPRGGVRIIPNPFNAGRGAAEIRIDLAKVQVPRPVTAAVFDLSGGRVRRLWDRRPAAAGRQRLEWDGRDDAGTLVQPGLYLLRVEVDADVRDVWMGAVGVVY